MSHVGVRAVLVLGGAGALWLVAEGGARADVISTRLPYIPAETLPALQIPGDPGSAVTVRIDPGDNDRPDPAPQLIITIGQ